MPAVDRCQAAIVRALEKADWRVLDNPYSIPVDDNEFLYADLRLQRAEDVIIVVEIKCFESSEPHLQAFYRAVGQILTYEAALNELDVNEPLYMAIPLTAYQEVFQRRIIKNATEAAKLKLIVIDLQAEVIKQWTT